MSNGRTIEWSRVRAALSLSIGLCCIMLRPACIERICECGMRSRGEQDAKIDNANGNRKAIFVCCVATTFNALYLYSRCSKIHVTRNALNIWINVFSIRGAGEHPPTAQCTRTKMYVNTQHTQQTKTTIYGCHKMAQRNAKTRGRERSFVTFDFTEIPTANANKIHGHQRQNMLLWHNHVANCHAQKERKKEKGQFTIHTVHFITCMLCCLDIRVGPSDELRSKRGAILPYDFIVCPRNMESWTYMLSDTWIYPIIAYYSIKCIVWGLLLPAMD